MATFKIFFMEHIPLSSWWAAWVRHLSGSGYPGFFFFFPTENSWRPFRTWVLPTWDVARLLRKRAGGINTQISLFFFSLISLVCHGLKPNGFQRTGGSLVIVHHICHLPRAQSRMEGESREASRRHPAHGMNIVKEDAKKLRMRWIRLREWSYGYQREGKEDRIFREFGTDMCTLLYLRWITNKLLLYTTENSPQCCVAVWTGEGFGGERIHICEQLGLTAVHLRWSQHWLHSSVKHKLKRKRWDFPGSPRVRIPCFHCRGHRFNPDTGQGTKIPHAATKTWDSQINKLLKIKPNKNEEKDHNLLKLGRGSDEDSGRGWQQGERCRTLQLQVRCGLQSIQAGVQGQVGKTEGVFHKRGLLKIKTLCEILVMIWFRKTRPGADCGLYHELLLTKFRLKLK